MKTQISRLIALASLFAGLGLSTSAHAVWTFDGSYNNIAPTVAPTGSNPGVATDPKVTLSGFNVVNGTNNAGFASGTTGNWAATTTADNAANTSNGLASQGAWGVGMYTGTDSGSPYHAIDNNGRTEGVLLSFDSSVVLKSIGLGYVATPNGSGGFTENCQNAGCTTNLTGVTVDVSVFRWVGTILSGPNSDVLNPTLAGKAGATMAGWELVGNYGDMVADNVNPYNTINGANKGSSWWLITAYNSGFTQSAGREQAAGVSLDNGNDYFKLLSVSGTQCTGGGKNPCGNTLTVPEPATLALSSVALLGVAGLRRRNAKLAA